MEVLRNARGLVVCVALACTQATLSAQTQTRPSERPKLYDTSADGNKQVADALKAAKAENKRIILKFGANW
jgi:hypothetical protein